jgi:hypothetical protein
VADVDVVTDRLLALIDGFGLRVLIGDNAVPLARARDEVWSVASAALGV